MTESESLVATHSLADLLTRTDAGVILKDKQGCPRLFFHGTRAPDDFVAFSCDGPPTDDEGFPVSEESGPDPTAYLGAHFAEEKKVAAGFANRSHDWMRRRAHAYEDGKQPWPRVLAVALKMKNPAIFGTEEELLEFMFRKGSFSDDHLLADVMARKYGLEDGTDEGDAWLRRYDSEEELRHEVNEYIFLHRRDPEEGEETLRQVAADLAQTARLLLQKQGFDGIRYANRVEGGTSWIAFDPGQILRAYADLAPDGNPSSGNSDNRFILETGRNEQPGVVRPIPIPQGVQPDHAHS